jgi:hypothetical protein
LFAHGPVVVALQRIIAGALLVFFVAWGIRARPQTSSLESTPGSAAAFALLFVVGVVTVLVIVGVLRIRVRRRDGDPEETLEPPQFTGWERIAGMMVAAVVLTVPAVAIWGWSRSGGQSHGGPSATPTHPGPQPGHPSSNATGSKVSDWVPVLAGVGLFVLVLAVGLTVVAWRRRHPGPDSETVLPAHVVASRARQPTAVDERDPRRAIIAAYRAFEHEAAALGVPTEPPRTAEEIAHHQITSRLARPTTVAALTGLFHRARYSSEPVGDADREYAEQLLARLRAELRRST